MALSHVTLTRATEEEVVRLLPEASAWTFLATGNPGDVDVLLTGVDPEDARDLIQSRGFELI